LESGKIATNLLLKKNFHITIPCSDVHPARQGLL